MFGIKTPKMGRIEITTGVDLTAVVVVAMVENNGLTRRINLGYSTEQARAIIADLEKAIRLVEDAAPH